MISRFYSDVVILKLLLFQYSCLACTQSILFGVSRLTSIKLLQVEDSLCELFDFRPGRWGEINEIHRQVKSRVSGAVHT